MGGTRTIRVLLIAPGDVQTPDWRHPAVTFDVARAADFAAAADILRSRPVDAVVLDMGLSADPPADLHRLTGFPTAAARLVLSPARVPDDPGSSTFTWLPVEAPADQQAELLWLAAEQSRAAQGAERSKSRFRDVIERNADALVVMNDDGVILFANWMAVELFGQARSDLIGSSFGYPAVAGETTELDIRTDGHSRVVEMRVVESEWEGRNACIASLRDITHRKQAEANARGLIREQAARSVAETAARRFRFLADSSTVLSASLDFHTTLSELARLCVSEIAEWAVVYVIDDAGCVRRLDVAHRDAGKRELAEVLRESNVPLVEPHPVLDVLRTRMPLLEREVNEERLQSLSENQEHVELIRALWMASFMVVPLTARDRSLGAIALIAANEDDAFDEDDLELAEDLALRAALAVDNARLYRAAQEINQTKSDLFAAISHDLRTPLNSIIGHADLLAMGIPETLGEGGLRHVERINKSALHLVHLIDDLLTLVRLEAGREELQLDDVSVGDVVSDVRAVVELLASERGLKFTTHVAAPDLTLRTDPSRLRQVLLNLIGNAIKYTDDGSIRLVVESDGDAVRLVVIDTGVGIASDDLEKMFEPFWQADTARRNTDKGTGLGLSVVQRMIALLGGRIQVESKPGSGSTFTVTLPVRHPHDDSTGNGTAADSLSLQEP
ncbi:MAG: PAS domain S-box protein [Gemmatimonadetes bacterium]|nr:PAS domain S-box protein [Gemmatimonadota bacterium]